MASKTKGQGARVKGQGGRIYAVILIGGKGKRLRPLSTNAKPKAFLSVTRDHKTMFRRTIDRIGGLVSPKDVVVVANKVNLNLVRKDAKDLDKKNLLLEPYCRNTAPAISLAAKVLFGRSKDAIMAILPADHYIAGEDKYRGALKSGINFVSKNKDAIVTIGIKPRFPATQYGYIRVKGHPSTELGTGGARVKGQGEEIYRVERFVEKPNETRAKQYLKDGRFFWNSGMFVVRAETILKNIEAFIPEIAKNLDGNIAKVCRSYKKMPDISIDYAVMEKARDIHCAIATYGWHDVGGFESLKNVLRIEGRKFIERDGKVIEIL